LRQEVEIEAASPRCREILGYLRNHGLATPGVRVVEVGCGSAIYGGILALQGAVVTLVDQSGSALSQAEDRASALGVTLEPIQADAFEFARKAHGNFDVAMSFGTVEHFRQPFRFDLCRAHADLVRPGGAVVISVPNLLFLPHEVLKRLLMLRKKWFLGYERGFTLWELTRIARRLRLREPAFHGTDVINDTRRYWHIVKGTRLWSRVFPWWRSLSPDLAVRSAEPAAVGRIRRSINRLLGLDITLLGVKEP
jgi:2-polyprenyl-3-methyl-5-hydroxy-6-metoxy-1,4-benzoquinol methylase